MTSFGRNTIYASIGNFSTTVALMSVIVAIARLSTPAVVGRYTYALAFCAPFFILASLRLRDISATESDQNYSVRVFFLISLATNAAALLALFPVAIAIGLNINTIYVALLLGAWKTVTALSDIVYGYHQRTTAMEPIAKLQLIHCLGTVVTFVTAFYFSRNLCVSIACVATVNLLLFGMFDLPSIKKNPPIETTVSKIDSAFVHARRIAWQTLPLGVGSAIFAINMLIPRLLIEEFFSLAILGVFSTLAICARLGTPFMQAMGQTTSRRLADAVREKDATKFLRLLKHKAFVPMAVGSVFVVISWFVGPALLKAIYGPEYVVSSFSASLIMIYATLTYAATFLSYGLIAARRHRSQLAILVATVVTGLIFGWFLIPSYGIEGACISLVFSSIVRILGTGIAMSAVVISFKSNEVSGDLNPAS